MTGSNVSIKAHTAFSSIRATCAVARPDQKDEKIPVLI
jgi:hypothetical protein